MGNQPSDMYNPTMTMWGHQFSRPNYGPKSYPNQRQKNSHMQRLNSIGEDASHYNQFQFLHLHSKEPQNNSSKFVLDFGDAALKTCSLRSSNCLSSSIPINCTPSDRSRPSFYGKNKVKFLKSHSLPERISNFNFDTMQHYEPDRSWSFGSFGEERTYCKEKPHNKFNHKRTNSCILSAVSGSCTAYNRTNLTAKECLFNNQSLHADKMNTSSSRGLPNTKDHQSCSKLEEKQKSLRNSSPRHVQYYNSVHKVIMQPSGKAHSDEMETHVAKEIKTKCNVQMKRSHLKHPECPSGSKSILLKENDSNERKVCSDVGSSNLSSVLFSPRKTSKKGRPSSKKQRKRKRQKQKDGTKYLVHTDSDKPLKKDDCDNFVCSSDSNHNDSVISFDDNPDTCLSQNVSTPVKIDVNSPLPNVHCFFSTAASSESESDAGSEEDEDADDWSEKDESEGACISPISGCGFSIALNLDSIFKQQHIPSLKSLLTSDCSEDSETASPSKGKTTNVHFSVSVSLSDRDSLDDSITFAASPAHSSVKENGFAPPQSKSQGEASGPVELEDIYSVLECLDADLIMDLQEANAKWEKVYSTPEACTCCNKNSGVSASSPLAKVQFVEEPRLSTVHVVGGEDRAGTWHHYALDRERFNRRIEEASQALSPILDEVHRSAIIKRNAFLLEQRESVKV